MALNGYEDDPTLTEPVADDWFAANAPAPSAVGAGPDAATVRQQLEAVSQGVPVTDQDVADAIARAQGYSGYTLDRSIGDFADQYGRRAANVTGGGAPEDIRIGGMIGGAAPASIQPFTERFAPPDPNNTATNGAFKFRLDEAIKAVSRGGLAKGTFFTNQTAKALQEQGAGLAEQFYGNDFNRGLATYQTNRDTHFQNEGQRFTSERTNRMDDFGIADSNRQFGRALTNDQWSRGSDLWNMNRQDDNDQFNRAISIGDMIQRYYPRPA